jgi:cell division initiation protein
MVNITPLDIQQQRFKTRFRGFDIQEVDVFLDQMADTFESLLKQNENLKEDFRRLQLEIQGYKNREDAFKRALLNKAHNRLAQLHEDIAELKRQRMQIEVQIGSVIEAHGKLLEISKEGMKAMDDEDSKIKLLQQNKA